ncbi:MAG: hypothetical protein LBL21_00525 [Rickettsiales bacterium]|nr:hypothetical protein [Rickettsiales bacterium]
MHETLVPDQTQSEQAFAQESAQEPASASAIRNTHEAPRFGVVILQKQFLFSDAVTLTDTAEVKPVTVAVETPHCDIPPIVCLTPGEPSSDVTAHAPCPVLPLSYADLVNEKPEFDNTPDLLLHAGSQSSWHSFIACASGAEAVNTNIDIKNPAYFIALVPFYYLLAFNKNHQEFIGGWSFTTIA